jgi:hypothetical protein
MISLSSFDSFGDNPTPSKYHPNVPHKGNIFVDQNFGCTYKDILEQFYLSQPIWNLMMKIVLSILPVAAKK